MVKDCKCEHTKEKGCNGQACCGEEASPLTPDGGPTRFFGAVGSDLTAATNRQTANTAALGDGFDGVNC